MRFRFILFFVVCTLSAIPQQSIKTTLTYSVNLPAHKTNKTPVLIMLHGYGSNESDLFDIAKSLDSRFITFSLRAPNATKNGGFCWYSLEFLPNQQFKYDYSQVGESKAKIFSFISNACKTYNVDSTQVFVMGFSQGAIMCYELALSSPNKIRGVLALSGRMMEETKNLKTDWNEAIKTKYFIAHGLSDNVIKFTDGESASIFLKEKKVADLTFKSYEIPHSISGQELNDIKLWLTSAITPEKKRIDTKK